ncbi:asparagine synthase-related protein [Actinosynnema sp. NPDC047251]|uniref:asparagine synthase (glutamine-hydrolyzing) n=1 Tax=Saccharothrix espanaensis (strain ATCC 51144 / DSM 44229 / JCM 9112 / NBRC 15066 / NRRL 15764) TaxID=1179773 RepID=K0K7Q8_SACES|nr:asparagine synthase-related protein [Saccharothrix espanaensis]CCH32653.1 asparagine synthase (glutamine-hydrolysing) [Saccharothrix espanaensis DSM 44229]
MQGLSSSLVALPDHPGAAAAAYRVPYETPDVVLHPSGRPWLVGRWAPGELQVATTGSAQVAVFGFCPVTPGWMAGCAERLRTVADADSIARRLPGSAHLIVSVGGQVRMQGSLTNLRRVFTTEVGDQVSVASDRADVLATMVDAGVEEDLLATTVVQSNAYYPLIEKSWWRTVRSVPPDSYVVLSQGGRARLVRWWRAPDPVLPSAQGAADVRAALSDAVTSRRPVRGRLSADLSGGMDSTTLCFLAAERTPDLLTFRWTDGSTRNDDPAFAARAARLLGNAQHVELRGEDGPALFAPPYDTPDVEVPWAMTRGLNHSAYERQVLLAHGSGLHLAGHGGDEVFSGSPGYLHSVLRRAPLTALRHLRIYRALGGWQWSAVITALTDRRSWSSWWHEAADNLTSPPKPAHAPPLGWTTATRAAPWANGDAIATARRYLHSMADEVRPLADDRGQHQALANLRLAGPLCRQVQREYATSGLRLDVPFLDDRVVEAALAVRVSDRITPWRYKPLLADAMRGIVPDFIRNRTTKGDYQDDGEPELRQHVPDLLDYFADSALAARGLIDLPALREHLLRPRLDDAAEAHLETTLGCEMWLRAITHDRPAPDRRAHVPAPAP